MISELFISAFMGISWVFMSILPTVPKLPQIIVDGWNSFLAQVMSVVGLIPWLYGVTFFEVIISIFIFLIGAELIWNTFKFMVKRIIMATIFSIAFTTFMNLVRGLIQVFKPRI